MLGSHTKIFNELTDLQLDNLRSRMDMLLIAKGYNECEIDVYKKAFDYFTAFKQNFDGATIVKDLKDVGPLDIDAMLHDYQYLVYNVSSNFYTKWKADWLYAKGQERKGKGQYSAFSRFIGLTIIGIGFVPYSNLKHGNVQSIQENEFLKDYRTLINN
ncbi:hypothetical protein [Flavobacterium sp.]|uniref:hypothetical protein n=1 Tax=Flavobacterium sp. TaxID=239 RepID=UPI003D6A1ACD